MPQERNFYRVYFYDHAAPMFGENKVVKLILDFMRLSDALYSPN